MPAELSEYRKRKAARVAAYQKIHGKKFVTCVACQGTGSYDARGSPWCGACDGRGKVRER